MPVNESVPYNIEVYFVQCSLSATTAPVMIDMEKNSLWNPVPISQPSTQWEMNQWTLASNTWQAEVCLNCTHPKFMMFNIYCLHKVGLALATPVNSGIEFREYPTGNTSSPSIVDELRLPFTAVLQRLTCGHGFVGT
jgi:hypothetical protein